MIISAVLAVVAVATPTSVQFNTVDKRAALFPQFGDHTGEQSKYKEGTGTYVVSADEYSYAGGRGAHCWTEFWVVSNRVEPSAWRRDYHSVDCATTSACVIPEVESTFNCTSWEAGAHVTFTTGRDIMSKVFGYEGSLEFGGQGDKEHCVSAEATASCEWDDKLCHQPWRFDMQRIDEGYVRRRCDSKKGEYTAWTAGTWRRHTIATHTKFMTRRDHEKSRARDTHGLCCTLQRYVVPVRILRDLLTSN